MKRASRRLVGSVTAVLLVLGWAVSTAGGEESVKVGGTGAAMRAVALLGEASQRTGGVRISVLPSLGSRGGRRALRDGAIDLAVSAEPLPQAERDQGLVARALGRTAFIFVVSPRNPVSGVSLKDIADLYRGQTLTWPDGSRVRPILRPPFDSDTVLMRGISPALDQALGEAHARPGMHVAATDQESAEAVETIAGAIGTSTLILVTAERRPIKALAVDGVSPTPKTVRDGSYPFVKTLYLVSRTSPPPAVQRFIEFLTSDGGRQALAAIGLVPL